MVTQRRQPVQSAMIVVPPAVLSDARGYSPRIGDHTRGTVQRKPNYC